MKVLQKSLMMVLIVTTFPLLAKAVGAGISISDFTQSKIDKFKQHAENNKNYTVIQPYHYLDWDEDIRSITRYLRQHKINSITQKIQYIATQFLDRPYAIAGNTQGESNWSVTAKGGTVHVKQDPIYRTDEFDCQTLVQTILALIHSTNLKTFQQTIIKVEYGGGGAGNAIHYYNRNNFASADFNKVNERHGFLQDVSPKGLPVVHAIIDKDNWFKVQAKNLKTSVRVLQSKEGAAMAKRFANYAKLYRFRKKNVPLSYYPKESLVKCNKDLSYCKPNERMIAKLPTPAVIEITRDTHQWKVGKKLIADVIGTQLNVSHMGILYDERFHRGAIIYQKITCELKRKRKVCFVQPVICKKRHGCLEKMYLAATDAYPNNYYYVDTNGHYQCTARLPKGITQPVYCNRVSAMPIGAYLASYQYGTYRYMKKPSIVGIHLEKIL